MTDPRYEALRILTDLLQKAERTTLDAVACNTLVEQVRLVPGFVRRVAHALSEQGNSAAVDALRLLPPGVPGVVEGLHRSIGRGVTRSRRDGGACPPMIALDFKRGRTQGFEELLRRAYAVFGDAFEVLEIAGQLHYRIGLRAGRGTLAGRASAVAPDLQWLHGKLGKRKHTRLWINGWPFASEGPFTAPIQIHLVRAWLSWAAGQTETSP